MRRQAQRWNEISLTALDAAFSTGHMYRLKREQMPQWAQEAGAITGAWLWSYRGDPVLSTGLLSTGDVHGHFDVERSYPDRPRFKYDRYFFIRLVDGRVFQIGPFKDVEYGHHLNERPAWFAKYCSESTSEPDS